MAIKPSDRGTKLSGFHAYVICHLHFSIRTQGKQCQKYVAAELYRATVAALNHFHHRSYFCVPKIFIVFSIYKCTWHSVGEFDFDIKSSAPPSPQKKLYLQSFFVNKILK